MRHFLFWGKIVIHSSIYSNNSNNFEKIINYKNFILSRDEFNLHLIFTRAQKVLRAGSIIDLGRGILFPLHTKEPFSQNLLEKMHDLYCGREISYPVNKLLSQQLYHQSMKFKLSAFNRSCPQSCQKSALTP